MQRFMPQAATDLRADILLVAVAVMARRLVATARRLLAAAVAEVIRLRVAEVTADLRREDSAGVVPVSDRLADSHHPVAR